MRIVEAQTLADVTLDLVACGGPARFSARRTWPLHEALLHLRGGAVDGAWRVAVQELPDHSIRGSAAIDLALAELAGSEVLAIQEAPGGASLLRNDHQLIDARRALLGRPVAEVESLYCAARVWDTLTSTAAKNWSQATRSSESATASGIPNLRQPEGPMRIFAASTHPPALAPLFNRRASTE